MGCLFPTLVWTFCIFAFHHIFSHKVLLPSSLNYIWDMLSVSSSVIETEQTLYLICDFGITPLPPRQAVLVNFQPDSNPPVHFNFSCALYRRSILIIYHTWAIPPIGLLFSPRGRRGPRASHHICYWTIGPRDGHEHDPHYFIRCGCTIFNRHVQRFKPYRRK